MEYDVFISHSSTDKDSVARPLAEALQKNDLSVWLDQEQLQIGGSIRRGIDSAQSASRFGIIILSNDYLQSEWAAKELDVLFAMNKHILPVFHGVSLADVESFSPALVGKTAFTTSEGISALTDKISRVIKTVPKELETAKDSPSTNVEELKQLGDKYKHEGRLEDAAQLYKTLLSLSGNDQVTENFAYRNLSDIYRLQAKYTQAIELLQHLLITNEKSRRYEEIVSDYSNLSQLYRVQGKLDMAIEQLRISLSINEEHGWQKGVASNCYSLGELYQDLMRFEEARELFQRSLKINEQLGQDKEIASNYYSLGLTYKQQGKFDQAADFFRQSLQINEVLGFHAREAKSYTALGLVAQEQRKLEKAKELYRKSLQLYEELGSQEGIAGCLGLLKEVEQKISLDENKNVVEVHSYFSPAIFPHAWASEWGQDKYGLWQAFTYKGIRYAFRWIPAGNFKIGSPKNEEGRRNNEAEHQVTLTEGFWFGEIAVTQELWEVVMGRESPSYFKGEELPVESITWDDCQGFISKVQGIHPDLRVRLPLETEWEYACRAGTTTPFSFGEIDDLKLELVNYSGDRDKSDSVGTTKPVKSYPPNNWGLYEMHGNIFEWCHNTWSQRLGKLVAVDPNTQTKGGEYVVRGGAWHSRGMSCRSAARSRHKPEYRDGNLGLRLVLEG